MSKYLSGFNGLELFFLVCAIMGGFFVFFKLIMQFIGGDIHHADLGVETDIGVDASHVDSDIGFRSISLQGLSAFFMMFGLVGLALYRQSQVGVIVSIIGAVAAGMGSVWIIGKLFRIAASLQSSGTLKTSDAINSMGTVYINIPKGGVGRVSLNFNNHLREFDATEKNGAEVPTGTPVRVVQVNANILVVETIY